MLQNSSAPSPTPVRVTAMSAGDARRLSALYVVDLANHTIQPRTRDRYVDAAVPGVLQQALAGAAAAGDPAVLEPKEVDDLIARLEPHAAVLFADAASALLDAVTARLQAARAQIDPAAFGRLIRLLDLARQHVASIASVRDLEGRIRSADYLAQKESPLLRDHLEQLGALHVAYASVGRLLDEAKGLINDMKPALGGRTVDELKRKLDAVKQGVLHGAGDPLKDMENRLAELQEASRGFYGAMESLAARQSSRTAELQAEKQRVMDRIVKDFDAMIAAGSSVDQVLRGGAHPGETAARLDPAMKAYQEAANRLDDTLNDAPSKARRMVGARASGASAGNEALQEMYRRIRLIKEQGMPEAERKLGRKLMEHLARWPV